MSDKVKEKKEKKKEEEKEKENKKDRKKKESSKEEKENNDLDNNIDNKENLNYAEKCDGCFDGIAICFCVNCEKIFCRMCEEQIHIVPSNRLHERVPIEEIKHLKKNCYHHNLPLKFYCESCEEPICHECQMIGPHSNRLHRVTNIFDSFRKKFNILNNTVQKNLIYKLDELVNQTGIIEGKIDEVKNIKCEIERGIRTEYSTMIENLRTEEGKKLAILQYESGILQKESNKIHEIITQVNEIGENENPDMVSFLLKYKQYVDSVEESLAKPIKRNIDISVDDLPRELDERNYKLEKNEKLLKVLKLKDDIIWNLINEKKTQEENEITYIREKSHNEIAEWAKLADKYAIQLKRYNLICHFCGLMLEENSVNSICTKNTNILRNDEKGSYTTNQVPQEYYNTKRHFYGIPNIEKTENINNNNNKNKKSENNLNLNIEQYIENLNNVEIRDPYYFNNKFIPNKNNNNKLIQLEVNENDILNILEKFNKIAKKMGFEIENSLISCFKDKRNSPITNEMISFYLKVRYELDAIELQKILIYFSENSEDPNNEFNLDEFVEFIRRFIEEKLKSTKKGNPFENNIYNMNDSGFNFNMNKSKSPQNKSTYRDESYRLEKNSNEWVFKVSSFIEKNNINLYRVFMEYDDDFDGYISPDEVRIALKKLQVDLTPNDIESMFKYFSVSNMNKINVKEFSQNFSIVPLK